MGPASGLRQGPQRGSGGGQAACSDRVGGVYVYGIVPADATPGRDLTGVGDPPGPVTVIRCGHVAALVSQVSAPWSLGSPRDLTRHAQILDSSASSVPVLPMRFGTMLADEDEVACELLEPNHDLFATALGELAGRVQYVVKARYDEEAIIREVLSENAQAARLRERIRGSAPGLTGSARIRLGEIVSRAIAAKRYNDTRVVTARLDGHCEASVIREPKHERDAVHMAVLVRTGKQDGLQRTLGDLAREWRGRVDLRLLGPMAAYDFVATSATGGA